MTLRGSSFPTFLVFTLILSVVGSSRLQAVETKPSPDFPPFQTALGVRGANGFTSDQNVGSGFGGDVFLVRHLTGPIWIEVHAGMLSGTIEANPQRFSGGDYRTIPLGLGLRITPFKSRLIPYASLGLDYLSVSYDPDPSANLSWQTLGFTVSESLDSTFGFHFGAGFFVPLSRTLYLNLEGRYMSANTSGTWQMRELRTGIATEGTIDDVKLGGFALRYGIALAF